MRDDLVEKCRQWLVRRDIPMIQPGMHCTMPEALAAFVGDAIDALEEKNASLQKELDRCMEAVAKNAIPLTTKASFEEWHRRECPWNESRWRQPCMGTDFVWPIGANDDGFPERFRGRTCRQVYESERAASGGAGAGEIGSEKERCLTAARMIEAKQGTVTNREERVRLLAEWCEDVASEAREEALKSIRVAVKSHEEVHAAFAASPTEEMLAAVIAERGAIVDAAIITIRRHFHETESTVEDPS